VAFRYQHRLAILLTPIIAGLMVATVYCRFHYVLDTIAGVALAFAVVGVYGRLRGLN
jgi:membrane-associated phospholipid phosphatase